MSTILFVSEFWDPVFMGGGEISAKSLAEALAEQGHTIFVLTSKYRDLPPIDIKGKIKVYRLLQTGSDPSSLKENIKRIFAFQRSLRIIPQFAKEHNVEIIHFVNVTSLPSFKVDIPTVATLNSYLPFCPKGNLFYKEQSECSGCSTKRYVQCILQSSMIGKQKMQWYIRYNPFAIGAIYMRYHKLKKNLLNIDMFLVRSRYFVPHLKAAGVSEENIRVEQPFIHQLHVEPAVLDFHGKILTYVGSLERFKGVDKLIEAVCSLDDPDLTLVLCGKGSLEIPSHPRIRVMGELPQSRTLGIIQASQGVIIPSMWPEPFSRVMIETLHLGRPLLATAVGGNVDGVIDGVNGYLMVPTVEGIRKAIQQWLNCDVKKMGNESRKIAEKFSEEKVLITVTETYKSLLAKKQTVQKLISNE